MASFRFKHVCIDAFGVHFPSTEVTSTEIEDKLAPLYQRLQIPFGTLEKLSGIKTRYLWDPDVAPSQVGTVAAKAALERISFDPKHIGAVINCSVTRDFFEPATACLIHQNLGLPASAMAFDVTNACIGFSNGLLLLGSLIDQGVIEAGIIVSGENISRIVGNNIDLMARDESITRDDLLQFLPTFTLGCGAVAYVVCHERLVQDKHRVVGSAAYSATEFSDLCAGNADYCVREEGKTAALMRTESSKLIASAAKLGGKLWKETSELLGWSRDDVDHIICHQVGKQVNDAFYNELGLDLAKEYTIYRKYGNMVSAALPAALALGVEELKPKKGAKIVLTAFGSGLNAIFTGIEW